MYSVVLQISEWDYVCMYNKSIRDLKNRQNTMGRKVVVVVVVVVALVVH